MLHQAGAPLWIYSAECGLCLDAPETTTTDTFEGADAEEGSKNLTPKLLRRRPSLVARRSSLPTLTFKQSMGALAAAGLNTTDFDNDTRCGECGAVGMSCGHGCRTLWELERVVEDAESYRWSFDGGDVKHRMVVWIRHVSSGL